MQRYVAVWTALGTLLVTAGAFLLGAQWERAQGQDLPASMLRLEQLTGECVQEQLLQSGVLEAESDVRARDAAVRVLEIACRAGAAERLLDDGGR